MKRLVLPALILFVAGCGRGGAKGQDSAARVEAPPGLECATDGTSDYGSGCTIERTVTPDGMILTLRGPTGSFRRLRVAGGRIMAADGAEPARTLGDDGKRVEVAIGGDRYRIPREALR